MSTKRYGLRFADTRVIPTVEVTLPGTDVAKVGDRHVVVRRDVVVKRLRGLTAEHAYRRALVWTRRHGDSR